VWLHQRLTQQVEQELHHLYLAVQSHMQAVAVVDRLALVIQVLAVQAVAEQLIQLMLAMVAMEQPIVVAVAVDQDLLEHALEVQAVLELSFLVTQAHEQLQLVLV
jgi:hypothetical protein